MRIAVVNTDYPSFVEALYASTSGLRHLGYADQLQARNDALFSLSDFYSSNLRASGHAAWEFHVNNWPLQYAWVEEHGDRGMKARARAHWRSERAGLQRVKRRLTGRTRLDDDYRGRILHAQLTDAAPDVVVNQAVGDVSAAFLRRCAPGAVLVGQIASSLPDEDLSPYDLMLSSLQSLVDLFRQRGLLALCLPFAFEPRILDALPSEQRDVPVSFVGGLGSVHGDRRRLLELLAGEVPLQVWGYGRETLVPGSALWKCHRGPAWGRDAYRVLLRSRITLNDHGVVLAEGRNLTEHWVGNLRLFEATGCGAALVTDRKSNLGDYFAVGREVAAFGDPEEALQIVRELLADEDRQKSMAAAGQSRTLTDHTYAKRMQTLVEVLEQVRAGGQG